MTHVLRTVRTIAGGLALALPLAGGFVSRAAAQEGAAAAIPTSAPFFGRAAFLFMPGILTTPVLGGIGPNNLGLYGGSQTKSYFNARFMAVVPTRSFFSLVAGVQVQPNFALVNGTKAGTPQVFYGAVVPFPAVSQATGGWAGLSIDPIGLYHAGGGGDARFPYGNDFVIEGALTLNFGAKVMKGNAVFGRSAVFVLLDQIVTHPPRLPDGSHDRWWPILVAGITLPVGG